METKKVLMIGGGVVLGLFAISAVAKNAAASAAQTAADNATSVIGQPGPVVSMPASTDSSSATAVPTTSATDLAALIKGQVDIAVSQAQTAKAAVGTSLNTSLIDSFLSRTGALTGRQVNLNYNDSGQVTTFSINNALKNLTEPQKATASASVNSITQNEVLASLGKGFTGLGTNVATGVTTLYDKAKAKADAAAAAKAAAAVAAATKKAAADAAAAAKKAAADAAAAAKAAAKQAASLNVKSAGAGR